MSDSTSRMFLTCSSATRTHGGWICWTDGWSVSFCWASCCYCCWFCDLQKICEFKLSLSFWTKASFQDSQGNWKDDNGSPTRESSPIKQLNTDWRSHLDERWNVSPTKRYVQINRKNFWRVKYINFCFQVSKQSWS